MNKTVVIDHRYCGPHDSGNGGYVCGLLAAQIPGSAEVTLRKPPPLGKTLSVKQAENGKWLLSDGDELVAEATEAFLDIAIPPAPDFQQATLAAEGFRAFQDHVFRRCFVCGPDRRPGDGLRIFAGPVAGSAVVAAPWVPDPSLAGEDGAVRHEHLWAALDCPGYFALGFPDNPACLLGRMTAAVDSGIRPEDRCVVIGWKIDQEGRKYHSGTALFGPDGQLHGRARSTWIRLKNPSE
jgi:hypothetical protein